jgi:hypothetical protein
MLRVHWAGHAFAAGTPEAAATAGSRHDRVRGCLIAAGLGDAVNLPAESVPRWLSHLRYPEGDCVSPSGHVSECLPAVVAVLRVHGTDFRSAMQAVFRAGAVAWRRNRCAADAWGGKWRLLRG